MPASYLDFPSAVGTDALPRHLRDAVHAELAAGETVLWAGQPDPARSMRSSLGIVFFGVPWTAFSVFWTVMAFAMTRQANGTPAAFGILFPLFGVPFILVGFGMLLSPRGASSRARATAYAVTDRRVLVVVATENGRHKSVEAFVPVVGAGLKRTETGNGRGDLVLPRPYGGSVELRSGSLSVQSVSSLGANSGTAVTLVGIPDVRAVERLVEETFARAPGAGAPAGVGALPAHRAATIVAEEPAPYAASGTYEPERAGATITAGRKTDR
jgi:hypothetical protein